MTDKHLFALVLTAALAIGWAIPERAMAKRGDPPRPNIVMIVTHDLGQHLGCYGVDEVRTPNIDRLAERGIRFANFYSTSGVCTPGRASLHTGRYPQSNGLMGLSHGPWWWSLDDDEKHTARYLKAMGYRTVLIGLSHLGEPASRLGYQKRLSRGNNAERSVEALRKLVTDRSGDDAPFFAKIGFTEVHRGFPHPPDTQNGLHVPGWLKPTEAMKRDLSRFQGEIRYMDKQVGRIMQAIDESDVAERTLLIFTSEHGIPYPGAKWTARKPGLEIPLILHRPGSPFSGGRVYEQLMSNVDVLPTLLDYLGRPIPDRIQGKSFMPLIRGEADEGPRDYAFGQYTADMKRDNESRTVITRDHQLIWYCQNGRSVAYPVGVHPQRFASHELRCPTRGGARPFFQLYNIRKDPAELNNIVEQHPELVEKLRGELRGWMRRVDDPLLETPTPTPYYKRARRRLNSGGG